MLPYGTFIQMAHMSLLPCILPATHHGMQCPQVLYQYGLVLYNTAHGSWQLHAAAKAAATQMRHEGAAQVLRRTGLANAPRLRLSLPHLRCFLRPVMY